VIPILFIHLPSFGQTILTFGFGNSFGRLHPNDCFISDCLFADFCGNIGIKLLFRKYNSRFVLGFRAWSWLSSQAQVNCRHCLVGVGLTSDGVQGGHSWDLPFSRVEYLTAFSEFICSFLSVWSGQKFRSLIRSNFFSHFAVQLRCLGVSRYRTLRGSLIWTTLERIPHRGASLGIWRIRTPPKSLTIQPCRILLLIFSEIRKFVYWWWDKTFGFLWCVGPRHCV